MQEFQQSPTEEQEVTLREQISMYLRYWPWFIISVIVGLALAFLYLRYTTPQYQTVATILIKDESNGAISELAAFQDLGLAGGLNQSGFENEIQILQSKSLTERVVRELNLNIRYFKEGNIITSEIFSKRPFNVNIISAVNEVDFRAAPIYIKPTSLTTFILSDAENNNPTEHAFGDSIVMDFGSILVSPNLADLVEDEKVKDHAIKVTFSTLPATVAAYRSAIQVAQVNKMSSVIQLSLTSPLKDKAQVILDELIKQYNEDSAEDRNMVSQNTADFIQNRLEIITRELDTVESGKVEFKQENRLTDIAAEGQLFLENASEFNKKQLEVETQLELVNTMIDYVRNGSANDLLPANLGIREEGVSSLIQNYNALVLERNRLLRSATESNPLVAGLTSQLQGLKNNVLESLNNSRIALQIARKDLRNQEARIGSEISEIPSKEKEFRVITRQQEIKEALYLYLLQKREETSITLAVTTPKAKVVDYAYSSRTPVSPNKQIILLAALVVGLLIPFLIIYVRQLLDNKIRNRSFIERKSKDISVVGEIPLLSANEEGLVGKNDRSVLAESFRILRTNLQYLFVSNKEKTGNGKTIFVTSTVKGEGKTLISVNLALTLANSGKKVLLIGADIRNPQLQRYMSEAQKANKGVVEYLIHENSTIHDYMFTSEANENMMVMISGAIPPNPAELWMQARAGELFTEVRSQFDYIVVDTAPAMLVTDTFLINQYADVTLYVMRAGYTEKRLIDFPLDSMKSGKLKNVAFVLNSVSMANFGYGNKYGYAYGEEEKTFWEKFKNSL